MSEQCEAVAKPEMWAGDGIDHISIDREDCNIAICLRGGKLVKYQPKLNLWNRGIDVLMVKSEGGWFAPKSEENIEQNDSAGATDNNRSDEICKGIMEYLLNETGVLTHCNIDRRREIKGAIKSIIDCKLHTVR